MNRTILAHPKNNVYHVWFNEHSPLQREGTFIQNLDKIVLLKLFNYFRVVNYFSAVWIFGEICAI